MNRSSRQPITVKHKNPPRLIKGMKSPSMQGKLSNQQDINWYPGHMLKAKKELAENLKSKAEIDLRCIHGDLLQHDRNEIIHGFKKKEFPVLGKFDR